MNIEATFAELEKTAASLSRSSLGFDAKVQSVTAVLKQIEELRKYLTEKATIETKLLEDDLTLKAFK